MEYNLDNTAKKRAFNMVNLQNDYLLSLGLKPSIIRLNPLYINLQGKIFYAEATNKIYWHKECELEYDVQKFLGVMREISSDTNAKNILERYYKNKCFEPYNNEHELSGNDIKYWINHNANVFLNKTCSYETLDAYNKETLELINNLIETKNEIYHILYRLFGESENFAKTVDDLLRFMRHYHYIFIEEEEKENDSFMHLPEVNDAENLGYQKMFLKASQDILVRLIGFDKTETQVYKTITTSKPNIYEEFFNEIITGWNIVQLNRVYFSASSQEFYLANYDDFINAGKNRECEEEAKWILKNVPYNKRTDYLK